MPFQKEKARMYKPMRAFLFVFIGVTQNLCHIIELR